MINETLPVPSVLERIERIETECASPLGYAQRGVASWEQDWLAHWKTLPWLNNMQLEKLESIERVVFGER